MSGPRCNTKASLDRAQRPSPANCSSWEAEAGGLKLIWLHSESEVRPWLLKNNKNTEQSHMQICPDKRAYFPTQNTSCALLYVASETWVLHTPNLCLWGHFGSRQKGLLLPVTISHWRNSTSQAFCQWSVSGRKCCCRLVQDYKCRSGQVSSCYFASRWSGSEVTAAL